MAIGNAGIYLGIVLAVAGIALSYLRLVTEDERLERWARWASLGLFGVVTVLVVYLYYLFLTADVSYEYVWYYTSDDAPLKYKFSGVLAGKPGSLLFWIWMITIPWAVCELSPKRRNVDPGVWVWTRIALMAATIVLLYVLALNDVFAATPERFLAADPDGQGLNALLQTDLMVIHPPVVFVAYGFMVLPFAAGFAYLITRKREWVDLSLFWSRTGWLFLTIGIAIGGVWAYTTLGWGGYWGWDPVETSSLLPWFLLSGFLHAQLMYKRKGDYPLIAPLMGIFSYILVVFATFATRAAGLWVSVHSFGQADVNVPAWERLTDLLSNDSTILIYFLFMIITSVLAVVLALRIYVSRERKDEEYFTLGELIDDDMLMFATVSLFILTTFVTGLILLGGVNGLSAENFNTPVGLLSLVGMLVLLLCLVWRDLGRRRVVQLVGVALLAGVIGGLVLDNHLAAFAIPILLVSMVGVIYKVYRTYNRKRPMASLTLVGAHLIHLSVVLILIGYVGSTLLPEETTLSLVEDGPAQEFGGYTFRMTGLDYDNDPLSGYAYGEVEVYRGNDFLDKARPGAQLINGQVRGEVDVVRTLGEDVYLVYHNSTGSGSNNVMNMSVKTLPLMNVLWLGMVLMWIGIVIRLVAEPLSKRRAGASAARAGRDKKKRTEVVKERVREERPPAGETERDDEYYEDLLERELKRI